MGFALARHAFVLVVLVLGSSVTLSSGASSTTRRDESGDTVTGPQCNMAAVRNCLKWQGGRPCYKKHGCPPPRVHAKPGKRKSSNKKKHTGCNRARLAECRRHGGGNACYKIWKCPKPGSSSSTGSHGSSFPGKAKCEAVRKMKRCDSNMANQCAGWAPLWPWQGCSKADCQSALCTTKKAGGKVTLAPFKDKEPAGGVGVKRSKGKSRSSARTKRRTRGKKQGQFTGLVRNVLGLGKGKKKKKTKKKNNSRTRRSFAAKRSGGNRQASQGKGQAGKRGFFQLPMVAGAAPVRRARSGGVCAAVASYKGKCYKLKSRTNTCNFWKPWWPWYGCTESDCAKLWCHTAGMTFPPSNPNPHPKRKKLDVGNLRKAQRFAHESARKVYNPRTKKIDYAKARQLLKAGGRAWWGIDYVVFGVAATMGAGLPVGGSVGVEIMYDLVSLTAVGYSMVSKGFDVPHADVGLSIYVGAGVKTIDRTALYKIKQCPTRIVDSDSWAIEVGGGLSVAVASLGVGLGVSMQADVPRHPAITVTYEINAALGASLPVSGGLRHVETQLFEHAHVDSVEEFFLDKSFSNPIWMMKRTVQKILEAHENGKNRLSAGAAKWMSKAKNDLTATILGAPAQGLLIGYALTNWNGLGRYKKCT